MDTFDFVDNKLHALFKDKLEKEYAKKKISISDMMSEIGNSLYKSECTQVQIYPILKAVHNGDVRYVSGEFPNGDISINGSRTPVLYEEFEDGSLCCASINSDVSFVDGEADLRISGNDIYIDIHDGREHNRWMGKEYLSAREISIHLQVGDDKKDELYGKWFRNMIFDKYIEKKTKEALDMMVTQFFENNFCEKPE